MIKTATETETIILCIQPHNQYQPLPRSDNAVQQHAKARAREKVADQIDVQTVIRIAVIADQRREAAYVLRRQPARPFRFCQQGLKRTGVHIDKRCL